MKFLALPMLTLALAACSAKEEPQAPASEGAASAAPSETGDAETASLPSGPDLAACKPYGKDEYRDRQASGPLKFPARFKGIVAAKPDQLAVLTLSGKTLCSDARWHDRASNPTLSADGRFFGYEWDGYEAFGYVLIDRAGKGQVIETGAAPLASPSGKRLASIDWSESGFGGLNGFGVWEVQPNTTKQLALITDDLPPGDWRLLEWSGENCVGLTLLPIDAVSNEDGSLSRVPRDFWFASAANHWKPEAGTCPKK